MKRKTLLAWSSGKDSAWALQLLKQQPDIDVVGLFCTVNEEFNRVAMHAVRVELLRQQAQSVGLPLDIIEIPNPCSNQDYEQRMRAFVDKAKQADIKCFAFGDLFLEDIRKYREKNLKGTGIEPIFPVWGVATEKLSQGMIVGGLRARITCIDPKHMPEELVGREYNESFLRDLPQGVDPCGENGEFHSFVFDGPMFRYPLNITVGEVVHRDGFVFCDLLARDA